MIRNEPRTCAPGECHKLVEPPAGVITNALWDYLEDAPEAVIARGVQMLRTPRSGSDETLVHDIWQAMVDEARAHRGDTVRAE